MWANFRVCPDCGGRFTVDADTKRRQAVAICVAIISLALTILLYFRGAQWLIPALVSYAVLGLIIYYGNRRVFLVPFNNS